MSVSSLTGYLAPSSNPIITNGLTVITGDINVSNGGISVGDTGGITGYNILATNILEAPTIQINNGANNMNLTTNAGATVMTCSSSFTAEGDIIADGAITGLSMTITGTDLEFQGGTGSTLITNLGAGSLEIQGALTTLSGITIGGQLEFTENGNTLITNLGDGNLEIQGALTTTAGITATQFDITTDAGTASIINSGPNLDLTPANGGNTYIQSNLTLAGDDPTLFCNIITLNGIVLAVNGDGALTWNGAVVQTA